MKDKNNYVEKEIEINTYRINFVASIVNCQCPTCQDKIYKVGSAQSTLSMARYSPYVNMISLECRLMDYDREGIPCKLLLGTSKRDLKNKMMYELFEDGWSYEMVDGRCLWIAPNHSL